MGAGIILMAYDKKGIPKILGLKGDAKSRKKHGKTYDLPKGTRDRGESMLQCAIRETFEETGVVIPRADIIDGPHQTHYLSMWVAEIDIDTKIVIEKNPVSGIIEHEGYAWLGEGEALKDIFPYLRTFVAWAFKYF